MNITAPARGNEPHIGHLEVLQKRKQARMPTKMACPKKALPPLLLPTLSLDVSKVDGTQNTQTLDYIWVGRHSAQF